MGLGCFVGVDELPFLREGFVIEKLRQCSFSWHHAYDGWLTSSIHGLPGISLPFLNSKTSPSFLTASMSRSRSLRQGAGESPM